MPLHSNERIIISLNGKQYSIYPHELSFEIKGEKKTLGDMLNMAYDSSKELSGLETKLSKYIETEASIQQLIANAHDSMALQLTQANDKISSLEDDIKALKAKAGID